MTQKQPHGSKHPWGISGPQGGGNQDSCAEMFPPRGSECVSDLITHLRQGGLGKCSVKSSKVKEETKTVSVPLRLDFLISSSSGWQEEGGSTVLQQSGSKVGLRVGGAGW